MPKVRLPLSARSPITRSGTLLTRMTRPIGFSIRRRRAGGRRSGQCTATSAACVVVALRDSAAKGDLPIGDRRIVWRDALNARRPVLIRVLDLAHLANEIAHLRRRPSLHGGSPCASATVSVEALPDPPRTPPAWWPQACTTRRLVPRLSICLRDSLVGPLAYGNHRNQGGDTDEDAEHGERRDAACCVRSPALRRRRSSAPNAQNDPPGCAATPAARRRDAKATLPATLLTRHTRVDRAPADDCARRR